MTVIRHNSISGISSINAQSDVINFYDNSGVTISIAASFQVGTGATISGETNTIIASTNGSERLRIDSSGNVGIGTDNPRTNFQVGAFGSGNDSNIQLATGTSGASNILFGDGSGGTDYYKGFIKYNHSTDNLELYSTDEIITYTGGSERLRINSSGNIGIGTTNPDRKLESVDTANSLTYPVAVSNHTSASTGVGAAIDFRLASNGVTRGELGLVYAGNNNSDGTDFVLKPNDGFTGNIERLRIKGSNGNIGIGTTNPDAKLHLYQSDTTDYSTTSDQRNEAELRITNPLETSGTFSSINFYNGSGTGGDISLNAVKAGNYVSHFTIKQRAGSGPTDWRERLRIDSSGRLLVGISSSATTGNAQYALLQVQGNSSGNSGGILSLQRGQGASSIVDGSTLGVVDFTDNTGNPFARILASGDGTAGTNDYPGRLTFWTTADSESTPTERMRIDRSGRLLVGITTNLSSSLGIQLYTTSPYFVGCRADNNPADDTVLAGLYGFSQSGSAFEESAYVRIEAGSNVTSGNHYGRIRFGTTFSGTSATRVGEFDRFGGLYIGPDGDYAQTNYTQTSGNGNFYYRRDTGSAAGSLILANNADRGFSAIYINKFAWTSGDDARWINFYLNGSSQDSITWTGSAINYGTSSDYRRKTNASTYTGGLEKVKQLHVREYEWIEFPEAGRTVGFFAHELQEIFPQAVTGVKDGMKKHEETGEEVPDYQGIDYGKITPLLAAALQEAIAKIETLEANNASLEARLTALESS